MSSSSSTSLINKAIVASAWLAVLLLLSSASLSFSDDTGFSPPPSTALFVPAGPPRPAALLGAVVATGGSGGPRVRPSRMDEGCAGAEDIAIYQAHASSLPGGVPAYTVDVINQCLGDDDDLDDGGGGGGCAIAGIHVRCGWFSSVSVVDPRKFRRLDHDDCLLNDGRPLLGGETLSFEYANSFPYDLSVRAATCVVVDGGTTRR